MDGKVGARTLVGDVGSYKRGARRLGPQAARRFILCYHDARKNVDTEARQMGHTLTLDMPEDVYQSLRQKVKQIGQSPEALAAQLLATATQHQSEDPWEQFIGAFNSQGSNWADHQDTYLGQSVRGV